MVKYRAINKQILYICRMKQRLKATILSFSILFSATAVSQRTVLKMKPKELEVLTPCVVENGDTVPQYKLPTIYVYPPMNFKNKKEEKFYWRTVRDVKRVLPLAQYIKEVVRETNDTLMKLPDKKARDRYMKGFEKELYNREEEKFKKLTYNQGKLLISIIDRELEMTSYELIKAYRGGFRAGFYQMFAGLFGASLKSEYGSNKDDEIIERIIILVQNGQL